MKSSALATACLAAAFILALPGAARSATEKTPIPQYFGGAVVSNAQIVMVEWNASSSLTVSPTVAALPAFYSTIVQSSWWDLFSQYSTNILANDGSVGTNQQIVHGAFLGAFTITPSNKSNLTDITGVATEIQAQIDSGILPIPTVDATGNVNTIYMVHFPAGISILNEGGFPSCTDNGIIGTFVGPSYRNLLVPIGIIPDQDPSALRWASKSFSVMGITRPPKPASPPSCSQKLSPTPRQASSSTVR